MDPGEGRGKAEGMGRTTEGDDMTKQQYHLQNSAAIEFVRLMLRLGVRMRA
jgi:hypothetical protein